MVTAKKMSSTSTAARRHVAAQGKRIKSATAVLTKAQAPKRGKAPAVLTLYRSIVPTRFGPFSVFTDTDGAVRWCDWHADEEAKFALMKQRWYRDTIFHIQDSKGTPVAAAVKLDRFFNPPTPAAGSAAALQAELDSIPVVVPPTTAPYTRAVWLTLRQHVRAGQSVSYKQLGELVAKTKEQQAAGTAVPSRAVGQAMARNPIPIIIPCHRVVGSTNGLHGYGCGLEKKAWLLKHERAPVPAEKLAAVAHEKAVCTKASCR